MLIVQKKNETNELLKQILQELRRLNWFPTTVTTTKEPLTPLYDTRTYENQNSTR